MEATEQFSKFVVETHLEDVPTPVVERAKDLLIDAVGAAILGASMPVTRLFTGFYKRRAGGIKEATVLGSNLMLPIDYAVLVNGTSLHSTELEAVPMIGEQQPAFTSLGALSAAECFGLSGKKVLEGFITGFEVHGRLSAYLHGIPLRGGWGCVTGTLGVAATTAKVWDFSTEQVRMALGLASSQAGGLIEHAGTMTHYAELGLAMNHGVNAALWVKEGVTAMQDVIENRKGFCRFYAVDGYDVAQITKGLGEGEYYITKPGAYIKKYPCCFRAHRSLDTVKELMKENHLTEKDIAEIRIDENEYDHSLLKYPEPRTSSECRFSMQHLVSAMMMDGKVEESSLSEEKIKSLASARKKVNVEVHPEWPPERAASRTPVTIKLTSGKEISRELANPIDPPREKFIEAFKLRAGTALTKNAVEEASAMLMDLEKIKDIRQITALLRNTK
jgi:2-methylcitrate dehydratase PrpD